jgi:hypothetical protein
MVNLTSSLAAPIGRSELAEFVASQVVRLENEPDGLRVSLPIVYPSGRWASVKIIGGPATFVVTDDGDAASEAEMMGALPHFARIARKAAEEHGVRFNQHEFFEVDATRDQLIGLAIVIAEVARAAVMKTAEWLATRVEREFAASLEDKLVEAFGAAAVEMRVEYTASSAHRWTFDAMIKTSGRPMLVSTVTPRPASVFAAFTKFDDVRRATDPPIAVAGVASLESFDEYHLVLLRRSATVRAIDAPPEEWRKLAA